MHYSTWAYDKSIQPIFIGQNYQDYLKINNWWFSNFDDKTRFMLPLSDIALINLPKNSVIDFSNTNTKPVYIFSPNYMTNARNYWQEYQPYEPKAKMALVVGWGLTAYDKRQNVRQKASTLRKGIIKTEDSDTCGGLASKLNYHENTMKLPDIFCGSGVPQQPKSDRRYRTNKKSKSSRRKNFPTPIDITPQICMGDSGGPIFFKYKRQLVQFGVSVWVDQKCTANFNGFLKIDSPIIIR